MAPLSSDGSLAEIAAAGLELASNTPSNSPLNNQTIASGSSESTVLPINPRSANTRGQPAHWTTEEKVQLWKADKEYQKDIKLIHKHFSEIRSQTDPYRSMDSLLKKRRELEAVQNAIVSILQMAEGLHWSKIYHKIVGNDPAEVRALIRKLKSDAPNKDVVTNRSYADYFSGSKKLEWFSKCCGELHDPGNEQAPTPPTMPPKRGPGRPRKNHPLQLRTPPSMGPRPTLNSSQGSSSFMPTTTFDSRSEVATAGRRPLAAPYMDEEFMVPQSPETEDETRHGRPAHFNAANSPSVASSNYPPANTASRIQTLPYSTQPLASRVPMAASVQTPSPPPVPTAPYKPEVSIVTSKRPTSPLESAAPKQAKVKDEEEDDGGWELLPSRPSDFPVAPKRRSGFAPTSTEEVGLAAIPSASPQNYEASPPTAEPGRVSVPPAPAQSSSEVTYPGIPIRGATRSSVPPSSDKSKLKTYHEVLEELEFSDLAQGLLAEHFRNPLNMEDRKYCEEELANHPRLRQSWLTTLVRKISGLSNNNLTTDELFKITKREQ